MDSDALRSVRNAFYLAHYTTAIQEANQLLNNKTTNSIVQHYAAIYKARAQAALDPSSFHHHDSTASSTAFQAIRQLTTYQIATDSQTRELALATFDEWFSGDSATADITAVICAARAYMNEKRYKDALKLLTQVASHSLSTSENLEIQSLQAVVHLSIERVDLAQKNVRAMSEVDDDDTLTQLTNAWFQIVSGNYGEANSLLQELIEKFGPSVVVLNALSVCELQSRNYTAAFTALKQARDLSIEHKQAVSDLTLLNTIVTLNHMNRGQEILSKVQSELVKTYPHHVELAKLQQMEAEFDKFKAHYKFKQ